jgi:hypothetical protein
MAVFGNSAAPAVIFVIDMKNEKGAGVITLERLGYRDRMVLVVSFPTFVGASGIGIGRRIVPCWTDLDERPDLDQERRSWQN